MLSVLVVVLILVVLVLSRIAVACWREALLRACHLFRLWRKEELATHHLPGGNRRMGHRLCLDRASASTLLYRSITSAPIPPEAEQITGTKQSFAPARDSITINTTTRTITTSITTTTSTLITYRVSTLSY